MSTPLGLTMDHLERAKARSRAKVEPSFPAIKRQFGHGWGCY
jgi:hypothetical protein